MARGPDPDEEQRGREAFEAKIEEGLIKIAEAVVGREHMVKLEQGERCSKSFVAGVKNAHAELISKLL